MARFEREAQVLALLNHSNIAAIYGLEESDGYWDATRCINWFPRIWPTAVLGILDAER
jgi:serine/threonine protein kinase